MSGFSEYNRYDALGLGALVRSGEVSPVDLLEEAIGRLEALNPTLNVVVTSMFELARQEARRPRDGPFSGVPFLLKDLLHAYAGVPLACGSKALQRFIPEQDSEIV